MTPAEPCSTANQITYAYYSALRELGDGRAQRLQRRNGSHVYYTYHLIRYWSD